MRYSFLALLLLSGFCCMNSSVNISSIKNNPPINGMKNKVLFKNMLGVNAYEWNFLQAPDNNHNTLFIYEPKMKLIENFSQVRHYMDWSKIEPAKGEYTFNPTRNGGWNYDAIYKRCKDDGIEVLSCLKTCPDWLLEMYPEDQRDWENVPVPYGSDLSKPASYLLQAKAGFQFAARYGYNKNIDSSLVSISAKQRWTDDPANEKKIGLGYTKYIECDNERDKWWKGQSTKQTAKEYAANLSAFYDGDKGRLGKGVGIKNADPSMKVVMAGMATEDVNYVKDIIEWCRQNRGYKKDGKVDLCFDVINYHSYSSNSTSPTKADNTRGLPPELSTAGKVANEFTELAKKDAYNMEVWITELGYDIHPDSKQRAMAVGGKTQLETQADWILRSCLLYARYGINKLFFYQLYDDTAGNPTNYATAGLVEEGKRRPAADYILQSGRLMGDYRYSTTLNFDPVVDVFIKGKNKIYVLTIPDEKGRTANYTLSLPRVKNVIIHHPIIGADRMDANKQRVQNGKLSISVTETPVFVEIVN